MILVIIGPFGSGKAAAVTALCAEGILQPHSTWTDRAARPEDQQSIEHVFVSRDEFTRLMDDGFFLGTAELFSRRYGLPDWPDDRRGLLTVIMPANLVDQFREAAEPEKVFVYQITAPRNQLADALSRRSFSTAELNAKLAAHDAEAALGSMIADRVFVNEGPLETLLSEMRTAIAEDSGVVVDLGGDPEVTDITRSGGNQAGLDRETVA